MPAIGCAAVVNLTPRLRLTHRMHRFTAASRQIAGKRAPTGSSAASEEFAPDHDPCITVGTFRQTTIGAWMLRQKTIIVGVSLLAIGCVAVVNPDASVTPDTPHAPVYCRCAPDRGQARSYSIRSVRRIRGRPRSIRAWPRMNAAPDHHCRSELARDRLRSSRKPDASVTPDTTHAPVCCRFAPDREQAHSYRFIRSVRRVRRTLGRFYSTFLNTNTNPTTISTIPSKLTSARRLP